ncbi:hypothetical protein C2E23DRAFT_103308 [Lenzites betulinus]|nr:hypothetical protein C2E23DRAFT_103308 [Lenzites betulinus]
MPMPFDVRCWCAPIGGMLALRYAARGALPALYRDVSAARAATRTMPRPRLTSKREHGASRSVMAGHVLLIAGGPWPRTAGWGCNREDGGRSQPCAVEFLCPHLPARPRYRVVVSRMGRPVRARARYSGDGGGAHFGQLARKALPGSGCRKLTQSGQAQRDRLELMRTECGAWRRIATRFVRAWDGAKRDRGRYGALAALRASVLARSGIEDGEFAMANTHARRHSTRYVPSAMAGHRAPRCNTAPTARAKRIAWTPTAGCPLWVQTERAAPMRSCMERADRNGIANCVPARTLIMIRGRICGTDEGAVRAAARSAPRRDNLKAACLTNLRCLRAESEGGRGVQCKRVPSCVESMAGIAAQDTPARYPRTLRVAGAPHANGASRGGNLEAYISALTIVANAGADVPKWPMRAHQSSREPAVQTRPRYGLIHGTRRGAECRTAHPHCIRRKCQHARRGVCAESECRGREVRWGGGDGGIQVEYSVRKALCTRTAHCAAGIWRCLYQP